MSRVDLVSVIEAIYRLEVSQEDWLRGIAEHSSAALGKAHFGAYALTYDASDVQRMRFGPIVTVHLESAALEHLVKSDMPEIWRQNPDAVKEVFRSIGYAPSRRLPLRGTLSSVHERLQTNGVSEILGINGINVDGRGAHVGVLFPRPITRFSPDLLARFSSHLAAGFRLRQRLHGVAPMECAEAVIEPGGAISRASGPAKASEARATLSAAAARLEQLRSAAGRRDPERAVRLWRTLVDARWSLVDHFERGGKRYVLAQRNDSDVGPFELLTERERQVVALAALGHPNKIIGYELGITVSTVGVLLARASRKVGASSRRALIEEYLARSKTR